MFNTELKKRINEQQSLLSIDDRQLVQEIVRELRKISQDIKKRTLLFLEYQDALFAAYEKAEIEASNANDEDKSAKNEALGIAKNAYEEACVNLPQSVEKTLEKKLNDLQISTECNIDILGNDQGIQALKIHRAKNGRGGTEFSVVFAKNGEDVWTPFILYRAKEYKGKSRALGHTPGIVMKLAQNFDTHEVVIVKIQENPRGEREEAALLALGDFHASVVRNTLAGVKHYLFSTLHPGRDLAYILRKAHLPLEKILAVLLQIAYNIEALHARGWLHLNIEPSNILIEDKTLQCKLVNFSEAMEIVPADLDENNMVHRLAREGRKPYAPLEYAYGYYGKKSDIFAFGTIVREVYNRYREKHLAWDSAITVVFDDFLTENLDAPEFQARPEDLTSFIRKVEAILRDITPVEIDADDVDNLLECKGIAPIPLAFMSHIEHFEETIHPHFDPQSAQRLREQQLLLSREDAGAMEDVVVQVKAYSQELLQQNRARVQESDRLAQQYEKEFRIAKSAPDHVKREKEAAANNAKQVYFRALFEVMKFNVKTVKEHLQVLRKNSIDIGDISEEFRLLKISRTKEDSRGIEFSVVFPKNAQEVVEPFILYRGKSYKGQLRALGHGSYGVVKLAQNYHTREIVALKVQDYEGNTFEEEALKAVGDFKASMLREDKEGIIKQYLFFTVHPGEDLCTLFLEEGSLSLLEIIKALLQVVRKLEDFHALGWLHRDIKPENIMYDVRTGECHLVDFSFAVKISSTQDRLGMGQYGRKVGSPQFMASEVSQGVYGKRTDYFAVGIIIIQVYKEYSKNHPEEKETIDSVFRKLLRHNLDAADPSDRPADLRSLMLTLESSVHALEQQSSLASLEQQLKIFALADAVESKGVLPAGGPYIGRPVTPRRDPSPEGRAAFDSIEKAKKQKATN